MIASVLQFAGTCYIGATRSLPRELVGHTEDTQENVMLLSEKRDRDFLA